MDASKRLRDRYISLLRDALLDGHHLENELRIDHLLQCARTRADLDERKLGDPARSMSAAFRQRERRLETGELPVSAAAGAAAFALADIGRTRLDHLERCALEIKAKEIPGDLVDCNSGRPGPAIFLRGLLDVLDLDGRHVWMADPFLGSEAGPPKLAGDLNTTRRAFDRFGLLEGVSFLQGEASRSLPGAGIDAIALLRIDGGDPDEISSLLQTAYPLVSPGGIVVVDDYADPRCQSAVDAFRAQIGLPGPPERVDASAAVWRKPPDLGGRAPVATVPSEREAQTKELSLVVVVHNMRREAARTLHSLSRTYQRGVDNLDYEVVVVENGSAPEEALGAALVESFGPEFRYLDMGDGADPSPAKAVNAGIEASTGALVGIMVDGAHVLTPGVLRNAKLAEKTYAPAVVTVKQWYVGPGQQPYAIPAGYDRELEDRLFDHVEWPSDGYRLFEIGHFIGSRDWFDGDWESNCIFVPRSLLEQAGAMDEAFSAPGGGFVNLDFYERMSGSPGVNRVTILGEGSFHQVHGGTTTNAPKPEEREALIESYAKQYARERGMPFVLPQQQIHYVGSLPPQARRTRRRPMSAEPFRVTIPHPDDQRPSKPVPIAENLAESFVEAFWQSQAAASAKWLGRRTHRPPTDLHVLQELICELDPGWIVETRTGTGGRALFFASICELIGRGRVLSIDAHALADRPEHELITYLAGDPAEESTASEAREILGEDPRALLVLGAAASQPLFDAFENLSPFVPVGSYAVFEDTILGGNPVWPAFGSGPAAAAARVTDLGDFIADPRPERFGLTFSPGGFLKRVR